MLFNIDVKGHEYSDTITSLLTNVLLRNQGPSYAPNPIHSSPIGNCCQCVSATQTLRICPCCHCLFVLGKVALFTVMCHNKSMLCFIHCANLLIAIILSLQDNKVSISEVC